MLITKFEVRQPQRIANAHQLVCASVPFAQGALGDTGLLYLRDEDGVRFPICVDVTQLWPDGSIRWIMMEFSYDLSESASLSLQLHIAQANEEIELLPANAKLSVQQEDELLVIDTPFGRSMLALNTLTLTPDAELGVSFGPQLTGTAGVFQLEVPPIPLDLAGEYHKLKVEIPALLRCDDTLLSLTLGLTFRAFHPVIEADVCLHNDNAALHPGGLWDLGDPGSIRFDSFCFVAKTEGVATNLILDAKVTEVKRYLSLVQHSSGGENWQSSNHVIATGEHPLTHRGYILACDEERDEGGRCQPCLQFASANRYLAVELAQFWQNFPSALNVDDNLAAIGLFPSLGYHHELQGGEQKTQRLTFSLSAENVSQTATPIRVVIDPEYIVSTSAFYLAGSDSLKQDETSEIIAQGLSSKRNFFAKREAIDEYGWRNFGDIFADHETIGEKGKRVTISHYNNQYDPIYGFIRQYLLTGDSRWFELADDLARHVVDIDLYKTTQDRDEYNHGMFWHTDHYLDAKTCSHRTFSRHHESVYDGYTAGGGPGGQHCYSLGLMYHYILTGHQGSKQAVVNLAKWMEYVYDGSDTVLAKLFAIKKSNVIGLKDHLTGQYPLDRGTGNLINAQLDAYGLTHDDAYLRKAAQIIENTVHPLDDISARNFENIEETWFYTVFLQATVRFLTEKQQRNEFDASFQYARDAFLHYAEWMKSNERPYLEQADKLEFPNTTWAAQDIRKGYLMMAAAYFYPAQADEYRKQAERYYGYVGQTLTACDNSDSTRILAILMQNAGAKQFFGKPAGIPNLANKSYKPRKNNNKYMAIAGLLLAQLKGFSVRNELRWLSFRSDKVAKLLGKFTNETN